LVKLSLFVMVALTVLVGMGLRWREDRMAALRPPAGGKRPPRAGWLATRKRAVDRWVTAAAIGAVATIVLLGGINWLRIWQGG
jgi:hypothetical protein